MKKPNKSSFFSSKNKALILNLVVGAPSGVVVELNGAEFDLRPFSLADTVPIFDLMKRVSEYKDLTINDFAKVVADEGPVIIDLMRRVLVRAVQSDDDFDAELFDLWFDGLDVLPSVQKLLPKLYEANGLNGVLGKNPLKKPPEETTPLE